MSDTPRTTAFMERNPSWGKGDMADWAKSLERENADLRAKLEAAERDAGRFLWLTADHDDADVRELVVNICNRLPTMSTSAVRMYIDAAMQEGK